MVWSQMKVRFLQYKEFNITPIVCESAGTAHYTALQWSLAYNYIKNLGLLLLCIVFLEGLLTDNQFKTLNGVTWCLYCVRHARVFVEDTLLGHLVRRWSMILHVGHSTRAPCGMFRPERDRELDASKWGEIDMVSTSCTQGKNVGHSNGACLHIDHHGWENCLCGAPAHTPPQRCGEFGLVVW